MNVQGGFCIRAVNRGPEFTIYPPEDDLCILKREPNSLRHLVGKPSLRICLRTGAWALTAYVLARFLRWQSNSVSNYLAKESLIVILIKVRYLWFLGLPEPIELFHAFLRGTQRQLIAALQRASKG